MATAASKRSPTRSPSVPTSAQARLKPWATYKLSAAELLPDAALDLLHGFLISHALLWQKAGEPPIFTYGEDSAPQWGQFLGMACPATLLRKMAIGVVCGMLGMEVERALRLLVLDWTSDGKDAAGKTADERHLALSKSLWRVGCLYRDLERRRSGDGPLKLLAAELRSIT
ncbi:MAG TPA: hypothetical protein VKT82_05660 [Ktedonobacterales bacterium]|nr:hypothetical protein [Ktedonobacterales bacterium]